ncbi:uncharacterized protein LOC114320593 [Camellia sinensis]|uniref:uncharacterized protein LOC114320593 n=1 Tax=Camellia sinensis TaxID=4442 RepID=UPI0010359FCF|nr:uncharacterized protein LOC114320593 [Camellia sinensis]
MACSSSSKVIMEKEERSHVLAVDDNLVDRKLIESLLTKSRCTALNPTAINSYLSGIEALSGTNFKKCKEQIGIVLGIMDLDYALREPVATKPNDMSSKEHMDLYEKWEHSNCLSLMIMKGSIMLAIQGALPIFESVVSYMKSIEEQFIGTSKSLATTLMIKMMTMKYNGLSGVREHIL